jgi:hypothetical protein
MISKEIKASLVKSLNFEATKKVFKVLGTKTVKKPQIQRPESNTRSSRQIVNCGRKSFIKFVAEQRSLHGVNGSHHQGVGHGERRNEERVGGNLTKPFFFLVMGNLGNEAAVLVLFTLF